MSLGKRILIYIAVIPTLLFFMQSAMISYMLVSGSVRPGDRMYGDLIAPSYLVSSLGTIVSLLVLLLLVFANHKVNNVGSST